MKRILLPLTAIAALAAGGCRLFHGCDCAAKPFIGDPGPAPPYYAPPQGGTAPERSSSPVYVEPGEPADRPSSGVSPYSPRP